MYNGIIEAIDLSDDIESRGQYNQSSADKYYAEGNFEKSFAINMISAKEGFAPCQYNVGYAYSIGEGACKDLSEAARWYKMAAEQDLPCAQHALAQFSYHYNVGDSEEAFNYLVKSSDSGFPPAQHLLAVILDNDNRCEESILLYKKAAEAGFAHSQHNLAICYRDGEGTPIDIVKAKYWFKMAADQGLEESFDSLEDLE